METMKRQRHWTESSTADFVYRISSDFIMQLEKRLEVLPVSQKELADRLNVTIGRVSQVFNNPGNLTLRNFVQYSRALGMKVAVVAYDDDDPQNQNGPINSDVFTKCWERAGRPHDFFDLAPTPIQYVWLSGASVHYFRPIGASKGLISESLTNSFHVGEVVNVQKKAVTSSPATTAMTSDREIYA